jgi:hypothetical protein
MLMEIVGQQFWLFCGIGKSIVGEMTRILMWKWLIFPPWQCSCALSAVHQEVFHEDQDSSVGTATLHPDLSALVSHLCYSLISALVLQPPYSLISLHWFHTFATAWCLCIGFTPVLQADLSALVLQPPYSLISLPWFNSNPAVWSLSIGSTTTLQPDLSPVVHEQPYCLISPVISQPTYSLISPQ